MRLFNLNRCISGGVSIVVALSTLGTLVGGSDLAFAASPLAQRGALTSWLSTTDNVQHIAYIGQNGHIYELYMHPGQQPWGEDDVTGTAGAPAAQSGALTSWLSASDNLQHIAYIGQNGHVYELYMHPGQQPWGVDDVTGTAGAPAAQSGALTSFLSTSDNVQHIAYIGQNGHVYELYMHPGQQPWGVDDVTGTAGAPAAQSGALTSWLSTSDNVQHIAYVGPYGQVYELYMHPGQQPWGVDDVTGTAGAPAAQSGALTSFLSTSDNVQHIAYIGQNGHVYELYMHPGQQPWGVDDVTGTAGAPAAQSGALTSWLSTSDNLQHIAYVGPYGQVYELYMHPGQQPWGVDNVTGIAGAPAALSGALTSFLSTSDNVQHIAYIGQSGHIYELYMRPGQQPWRFDATF
jgi:hypothetical protein